MMKRTSLSLFILFCFTSVSAQLKSTLPIVVINTNGKTIVDEPKIMADMRIMFKGNGLENTDADSANIYNGKIGIEFRGSSSQLFPKKPFGFETWNAKGEDIDVGLFGWPAESDWILFASYNEKSLMHNVLTMKLARQMGIYASRTQYVEVVINGSYEGVYVLMEKVKRDKGRVDVSKLDSDENSGDDLTGGYIVKIDKSTGSNNGFWQSTHALSATQTQKITYLYEYPKDPSTQQKAYIKGYVDDFEKALKGENFADPTEGYRKYIDVKSFIRLFLLNEVSHNVDGYRISTYMYKDKDSKGGKLTLGPPWDYDISYGNANYCEGGRTDVFSYKFNDFCPNDGFQVPFWWPRLLQDPAFVGELRETYLKERESGILTDANLTNMIDGLAAELEFPQRRNFTRWKILGTYIWPNPQPIPATWEGEVSELRNWLRARMIWLDANIPGAYVGTENIPGLSVKAYPNPFIDAVSLSLEVPAPTKATLVLYDSFGREHLKQTEQLQSGSNVINLKLPENASFQQLQFLSIEIDGKKTVKKLVRSQTP